MKSAAPTSHMRVASCAVERVVRIFTILTIGLSFRFHQRCLRAGCHSRGHTGRPDRVDVSDGHDPTAHVFPGRAMLSTRKVLN